MTEKTLLVWPDLRVGIRYAPVNRVVMSFEVIQILGGEDDGILWVNDEGVSSVPVEDHNQASVYMDGDLKWDGCMNMEFPGQKQCMLHFCGKDDATNTGAILGRIYDVIGPLMASWAGD